MNSIVLNNNMMMMRMNTQSNQVYQFPSHFQQQEMEQSNNYFTSLLLSNESKTSLDEVQINSPLFLKLDIDDLLLTLQEMNLVNNQTQQEEQHLPTTPSSNLNTSTDM